MLSEEQRIAFEKFQQGHNVFISGAAGCGKSYLIKLMYEYYEQNIQITSTTGCSAVLLSSMIGKPCVKTIHVWSGIRMLKGTIEEIVQTILSNKSLVKNWKRHLQCLVIDEVSMLSAKLMTILETVARYTKNPHLPFGGLQVIFLGDMYQLSPVQDGNDIESGKYCFESPCWKDVFPIESCIELKQIFRQTDPLFCKILNEVRIGELSEESSTILKSYVGRTYDDKEQMPMKIFPTRAQVTYFNNVEYEKATGEEYQFQWNIQTNYHKEGIVSAKDIIRRDVGGRSPDTCRLLAEERSSGIKHHHNKVLWHKQPSHIRDIILQSLKQSIPVEEMIKLKIGIPVMCVMNINLESGISNGSMGIIEHFVMCGDIKIPVVRFTNGVTMNIYPYTWQDVDYPNIAITQIPLCLSYSSTIHKLQGSTLDMAEMNLGNSVFAEGQCYVGLSRVKSLQGLYLTAFHPQKIKVNEKVRQFYQRISKINIPHVSMSLSVSEYCSDKPSITDLKSIQSIQIDPCIPDLMSGISSTKHCKTSETSHSILNEMPEEKESLWKNEVQSHSEGCGRTCPGRMPTFSGRREGRSPNRACPELTRVNVSHEGNEFEYE